IPRRRLTEATADSATGTAPPEAAAAPADAAASSAGAPPSAEVLLPPGYRERHEAELRRRLRLADAADASAEARALALAAVRADVVTFVNDWCWTYDPRLAPLGL